MEIVTKKRMLVKPLRYTLIAVALAMLAPTMTQGQIIAKVDTALIKMKERKADLLFSKSAYAKAIEIYEELATEGFEPDSLRRNLGIAYYKISDTQRAEATLKPLAEGANATAADYYFYSAALKFNGRYDEADRWLDKYLSIDSTNQIARNQKDAAPFIHKLLEKERYKIAPVPFNSTYSDFGAVPYENEIIFTSARPDESIIKREDAWKDAPYFTLFSINKEMSSDVKAKHFTRKLNTIYHDGPICFNADQTEIFVTRNNYRYHLPRKDKAGVNNLKILTAKKTVTGSWGKLEELPFDSDNYSSGHPSLSADGNTLYFASDMPGGYGKTDIYYVTRTDKGWSAPVNLGPEINTEGDEMFPFIGTNDLLYFSSTGHMGMGGLDIFVARKDKNGHYSVKNMGYPLNSSADDFSFFLNKDGKTGFFASNRTGGVGDDDIYSFTITDPISFALELQGTTADIDTKEWLSNVTVTLKSNASDDSEQVKTGDTHEFKFELEPEMTYTLTATRDGYQPVSMAIDPQKMQIVNDIITIPLQLKKVDEYGIYGNIYLKPTMEIIPAVHIQVIKKDKTVVADLTTEGDKGFRVKLEPDTNYDVVFDKKGFLTKRVEYSTKGRKPGYININEIVEVALEKVELNKTIEIPNIYYDLGKWNIRPDAAIELDKVVQFLKDNPDIKVELGSHTDSRGSDESNLILSQKRAKAAVEYIVKNGGISADRITAKGYGETRLKNKCANGVKCTEAEHQQNRRTEIKITGF